MHIFVVLLLKNLLLLCFVHIRVEFTKTLWLQDATQSLRNILAIEAAQQAFMAFLKTEYGK